VEGVAAGGVESARGLLDLIRVERERLRPPDEVEEGPMSTRHLERLERQGIPLEFPADEDGFVGRECPDEECQGYFKVTFGTGLTDIDHCICPYCGTKEGHDQFFTQEQIKYAESVAARAFEEAIYQDMKGMEFEVKPPRGSMLGFGMSLKVERGRRPPVHRYREKLLETEMVCDRCTLRYAIYGVFGYCPDCGAHNSLDILEANLGLVGKMLGLAEEQEDRALARTLVENALEDCVSAFDGWGRATAEAFATKASEPSKAKGLSFQNIEKASRRVAGLFGFEFSSALGATEFDDAHRAFQKRHVVAHKMGVVDQAYVDSTGDITAIVGRKVVIRADDVRALLPALRKLSGAFVAYLEGQP